MYTVANNTLSNEPAFTKVLLLSSVSPAFNLNSAQALPAAVMSLWQRRGFCIVLFARSETDEAPLQHWHDFTERPIEFHCALRKHKHSVWPLMVHFFQRMD